MSLLLRLTSPLAAAFVAIALPIAAVITTPVNAAETMLLDNIHGYRVDDSGRQAFSALFIEDGKVRAHGDAARALAQSLNAKRVDGGGKTVLPGLIDAHGHVQGLGQEKSQIDLRGSATLAEALQRIKRFADDHPNNKWLLGRGWNQVLWEGKQFPTAHDLDAIIANRPIVLERIDGHATWVNTAALKLAGITRTSREPDGGQIIRDQNGEPTGVFVDNAMVLVSSKIPPLTDDEQRAQFQSALQELASLGMTGVHDAGISPADYKRYQQLGKQKALPIRVYAMLADSAAARDLIKQAPPKPAFEHRLYLQSVKASVDGALGSRGAAMLTDYSDQPGHKGLLLYSPAQLHELTKLGISNGWQMNIHAIGDAGNRVVLDTLADLSRDGKARALRHRVEHAQVIALDDIPRFKSLNVIASVQPTHATSDMNMAEARIGADRIKGAYAWRKLLDAGARLAGGSDFPVELANPFYGLHAAVTRSDRNGQPPGGWYPGEKLSRDEALKLFTHDAAYAGHMETITGSLAVGQYADFIVVDRDFFTIAEQDIANIQVLSTWVAGQKIFSRAQ